MSQVENLFHYIKNEFWKKKKLSQNTSRKTN